MLDDSLYNGWIPLNRREKLSFGRIMAIASGNMISRLQMNIAFLYFAPLCNEVGLESYINLLILTQAIIEFFLTPFIGAISDALMSKFGRRRIFIIIGTILSTISILLLIFNHPFSRIYQEVSLARKTTLIISIELIFISVTLIQNQARSLSSDLTPPIQQTLMSHACQFFIAFAPIIPNIINGLQIQISFISTISLFLIINSIMSIISLIACCVAGKEEPLHEKPPTFNPFKQMYNAFKKMSKPFKRVILPYMFSNAALLQFNYKFTDFVGSYIFQTENNRQSGEIDSQLYYDGFCFAILCMAVNNGCQLLYSFVNWKIVEKVGMKWSMFVGNLLLTIALVLVFWIDFKYAYFLIAGLIGICQVIVLAVPNALVSIVVSSEDLGINLGLLNSFAVIGQQVSNLAFAALIGFSVSKKKPMYLIGFSSVFGLVAALISLFMVEPTPADTGEYNYLDEDDASLYNEKFTMVD